MGTTLIQNPRKTLAAAIEINAEALAAMHSVELTLQKARDLHCGLLAQKADAFTNLDNSIASARAANLKRVLEGGDEEAHLLTQEPQGFAAAKIAREQLDEKIQAVEASLPTLESELIEARKAAEMADFHLDQARAAVFAYEAEKLAIEFHERLHDLRLASIRLAAMANRPMKRNPAVQRSDGPYYGGGSTTIPMPPSVLEAVAEPIMGNFDRKTPPARKNEIAAAVSEWWGALRNDPNATLSAETKEGLFLSRVRSNVSDASDVSGAG
ncbi:hypothetical protein [Methylocystis echinoides]|uniref:hypothetical protein n=1 Tax=Methylocystis echinoides TaxID=29468 RepID=UPI003448DDC1